MVNKSFFFLFTALVSFQMLSGHHSPHIDWGKWSYGSPEALSWGEGYRAQIGKYCSIARGVEILLGGDHCVNWVTTYPFSARWPQHAAHLTGHPRSKGHVIIGNDVWIGTEATILSGVKIGHGAVVGAHAVVAKDVPPYAIVVGNPARVAKYRFDEETIKKLLIAAWWDWPEEDIIKALPLMMSEDIQLFLEYCESTGKLPKDNQLDE